MTYSKKIYKNSFFYMVASLLPAAVNFLVLPIFTRYLSPKDYGILALIQSFIAFMPLVLSLQIHRSIGRFYFDYEGKEQKILISTIGATLLFFSCLGLVILFLFSNQLLLFVFPNVATSIFLLFKLSLIAVFFNTLSEYFKTLLITREKAKLFMMVSICLFWVGLAINIVEVVVLKRGVYGIVEGSLILSVLSFISFIFFNRHYLTLKLNFEMLKGPFKYSLPIIPHALAGIIFMYSDRIILEKYVFLSAIGLYSLADRIAMPFKMMANQISLAFQPHFFKTAKKDKHEALNQARNLSKKVVFVISFLVALFAVFSVEIVYYIFDKRFFNAWIMIPILASSYVFRSLYCFGSYGLFFEKRTVRVAMITVTAAVINIVINLVFIPRYGVIVAVFSTLIAYSVTYLMAMVMSMKSFYVKLDNKSNLIFICYMYGVIVVSFLINSKFTLENPHLSLNSYFLKILMVVLGLLLGLYTKLLSFDTLGFPKNILNMRSNTLNSTDC